MAGKKTEGKKASSLTKSALVNAIVEESGEEAALSRKQVKAVLEALGAIAVKELKKAGIFTVPGFAKFRVVKKAATKAREGINPFTKQPITIAAKPASKAVRARPVKALKDGVA